MSYIIISSSPRAESQTRRTADYILSQISKMYPGESVSIVDLHETPLPMFDASMDSNTVLQDLWNPISKQLTECTAAIFVTPEWNGMASPALKNFCMFVDSELAHKPVLLVSVTAGMTNGAYPIAEMRMSSFKNADICYIPNHIIIRSAGHCFHDDIALDDNKADKTARDRIEKTLKILSAYSEAMMVMRKNSGDVLDVFDFGM